MNILEARISVDYPNKPGVLRDVHLNIAEGEILGLVGESGSGKRRADREKAPSRWR
jgi:ABC-type dipeptide/oligopeptide/nickel transport system ATPase subunit